MFAADEAKTAGHVFPEDVFFLHMNEAGQPLVSVVVANYNYGRFLETAVRSVLTQCDADMMLPSGDRVELIVVDGGSTDNSLEVIRKYERRLAWWCSERDGGQSHALNKGFTRAAGKYLTWLNADDVMLPQSLEAVARMIKGHPACRWFVGGSCWLDAELRLARYFRAHRFSGLRARHARLHVGGPSSFFAKALLEEAGGVDESFHFAMDLELWARFYFRCGQEYVRTKACVWGYRMHGDSKMSGLDVVPDSEKNKENRRRSDEEIARVCRMYGQGGRWGWLANVCSVSVADALACAWRTWRMKGRRVI